MSFTRYMKFIFPIGAVGGSLGFWMSGDLVLSVITAIIGFIGFLIFHKEQTELVRLADNDYNGDKQ